jgi:hypothetical protein
MVMGWSAASAAGGLTTGKRGRLVSGHTAKQPRRYPMNIYTIGIDSGKTRTWWV